MVVKQPCHVLLVTVEIIAILKSFFKQLQLLIGKGRSKGDSMISREGMVGRFRGGWRKRRFVGGWRKRRFEGGWRKSRFGGGWRKRRFGGGWRKRRFGSGWRKRRFWEIHNSRVERINPSLLETSHDILWS